MAPSTKQWNYGDEDIVLSNLIGLTRTNPLLRCILDERVCYNAESSEDKVMLLAGGGSGHEPLHAGFVGNGLLDVAVAGSTFASPSTKQILAGIRAKESKAGTVVIVKNYTGDVLHFGLAVERAKAEGYSNIELILVGDDVSVGKTKNGLVGRRGLAGTALVHKVLGAKAAQGSHLKEVASVGRKVVKNLVTIGASLDHCLIPGRDIDDTIDLLGKDEIEIGMGIHNEAGVRRISPIPTINELISLLLTYLLSPDDEDRHYVSFDSSKDDVVLLVNNLGGTSNLEMYTICKTILDHLSSSYKIKPVRVYCGHFTTSLNGDGFSITLLNATQAGGDEVLELLDAPTDAPAWNSHFTSWDPKRKDEEIFVKATPFHYDNAKSNKKVNPDSYIRILKSGMKAVLEVESELTHYDTITGDGDCGETLASGANAILKAIADKSLETEDIVQSLVQITDIVESNMGGTSGGLYSIFISSLAHSLRHSNDDGSMQEALKQALNSLFKYTRARIGDRTIIDTLQPFIDTFYDTNGDFAKAKHAARIGAESTKNMKAKFGRASYVDEKELRREGGLPDPGALGLYAIIEGFYDGYSSK